MEPTKFVMNLEREAYEIGKMEKDAQNRYKYYVMEMLILESYLYFRDYEKYDILPILQAITEHFFCHANYIEVKELIAKEAIPNRPATIMMLALIDFDPLVCMNLSDNFHKFYPWVPGYLGWNNVCSHLQLDLSDAIESINNCSCKSWRWSREYKENMRREYIISEVYDTNKMYQNYLSKLKSTIEEEVDTIKSQISEMKYMNSLYTEIKKG